MTVIDGWTLALIRLELSISMSGVPIEKRRGLYDATVALDDGDFSDEEASVLTKALKQEFERLKEEFA